MKEGSSICYHIESGAKCFIINIDPITVKPAFDTYDIGNGIGSSVVIDSEIDFNKKFQRVEYIDDGTLKNFYSGQIVDSGYKIPIHNNQIPFNITFSWNGTEKTVSLVNGEDVFILAGMFEKLLKDYGIEYKSEINIR